MEFILFLLSILIATFYYLRLSRRFNSFDVELSDEIRSEMTSLITEFNASAQQNITLIEDRINESKQITKDLIEQLNYLKNFKESLEKEIKDTQRKLNELKEDEKIILEEQLKQKSLISATYNRLNNQINQIEITKSNIQSQIAEKSEDVLQIESVSSVADIYKQSQKIGDVTRSIQNFPQQIGENTTLGVTSTRLPLKEVELVIHKEAESKGNEVVSIKERIFTLKNTGALSSEIARELGLSIAEVELTLRLFMDEH